MLATTPPPASDRARPGRGWRRAGAVLASGLVLALVPALGAGADATGCPPGIDDPGLVSFEDAGLLERVEGTDQAYLDRLAAGFAAIDANGDGALCLKAVSGLQGQSAKQLGTYYQAVDNSHPNK